MRNAARGKGGTAHETLGGKEMSCWDILFLPFILFDSCQAIPSYGGSIISLFPDGGKSSKCLLWTPWPWNPLCSEFWAQVSVSVGQFLGSGRLSPLHFDGFCRIALPKGSSLLFRWLNEGSGKLCHLPRAISMIWFIRICGQVGLSSTSVLSIALCYECL